MLKRLLHRYGRLIRYVIVGGGMALLYSAMTAGLIVFDVVADHTLASFIASLISIPISFLVHRSITYSDVRPEGSQWLRFTTIAMINVVINTGGMKLSVVLHWPFWIALVTGWVLVPIANYLLNAVWVFRTRHLLELDS